MTDEMSEPETGKVFLSYSRKDRERASGIADALRNRHFGVFKDTDDILPTEEWKTRLQELIEEADTIVFLLSPNSAASEVCAWEVDYATALEKRIAPIVIEETEPDDIPPLLARLNFIFCTPRDPFDNAVDTLVSALSTDIAWIREHTRLAGLAKRWDAADRRSQLLLRGQDIADAEQWRDSRPREAPAVTETQAALIAASRRAATKRQRNWVSGAVLVSAGAIALAVFAWFQSVEADRQRIAAERSEREAIEQRNGALLTESRFLAAAADRLRVDGQPEKAVALALRALPDPDTGRDRPLSEDAAVALREAMHSNRMLVNMTAPDGASPMSHSFNADGSRIAAGYTGGTARIWNTATGEVETTLNVNPDPKGWGVAVALSPDGSTLLSASGDGVARLWNLREDGDPRVIYRTDGVPRDVAISSDGLRALVTDDRNLILFALSDGQEIARAVALKNSITQVAFSPDGKWYAAGSSFGGVVVWKSETGDEILRFEEGDNSASTFAFHPDSTEIALSFQARERIEAFTLKTAQRRHGFDLEAFGPTKSLAYHPNGWALVRVGDPLNGYSLYSARDGSEIRRVTGVHEVETAVASFVGAEDVLVASGDEKGDVRIWRPLDNVEIARLTNHGSRVLGIDASPDGTTFLSSSLRGEQYLWRARDALAVPSNGSFIHRAVLLAPGTQPDQTFVVSSEYAGLVDTETTALMSQVKNSALIDYAATSPDAARLALAIFGGGAYGVIDYRQDGRLAFGGRHTSDIFAMDVSPVANQIVVIDTTGGVTLYSEEPEPKKLLAQNEFGTSFVAFTTNGEGVLLYQDGAFVELSTEDGSVRRSAELRRLGGGSIALNADQTKMAYAYDDTRFVVRETWDPDSSEFTTVDGGDIAGFAFNADSSLLAVGTSTGVIHLYTTSDLSLRQRLFGALGHVQHMLFAMDDSRLIAGDGAGRIRSFPLYPKLEDLIIEAAAYDKRVRPLSQDDLCAFNQTDPENCD